MAGQRVGKLGFRGSWAGARPSPAAAEASAAEAVPEHELKVKPPGNQPSHRSYGIGFRGLRFGLKFPAAGLPREFGCQGPTSYWLT